MTSIEFCCCFVAWWLMNGVHLFCFLRSCKMLFTPTPTMAMRTRRTPTIFNGPDDSLKNQIWKSCKALSSWDSLSVRRYHWYWNDDKIDLWENDMTCIVNQSHHPCLLVPGFNCPWFSFFWFLLTSKLSQKWRTTRSQWRRPSGCWACFRSRGSRGCRSCSRQWSPRSHKTP